MPLARLGDKRAHPPVKRVLLVHWNTVIAKLIVQLSKLLSEFASKFTIFRFEHEVQYFSLLVDLQKGEACRRWFPDIVVEAEGSAPRDDERFLH